MLDILEVSKIFGDEESLKSNFREDRFKASLNDKNPTLLVRMKSGFLYMMDKQFIPGFCVLSAYPKAKELNNLTMSERQDYLMDVSIVGEAIENVVENYIRMNYSILGNTDNYLHTHIYPRYEWEEEKYKRMPVWLYDMEDYWKNNKYNLGKEDIELGLKIANEVIRLCNVYYT